jgi:hypothetical protein
MVVGHQSIVWKYYILIKYCKLWVKIIKYDVSLLYSIDKKDEKAADEKP